MYSLFYRMFQFSQVALEVVNFRVSLLSRFAND